MRDLFSPVISQDVLSDSLWQRIQEYQFDAKGTVLTFVARVMRDNGWSREKSLRALDEYRRFVYLACRAGHRVTPSDEIDQVWHLHLQYTREYWENFCLRVLGQPLHHEPTMGGGSEDVKFSDWYARTLHSYQRIFQCNPPQDLWPKASVRFGDAPFLRRVNTKNSWVVPKKWLSSLVAGFILCTTAFTAAASDGLSIGSAVFILVVIVILAILIGFIRPQNRKRKDNSGGGCGGGCGDGAGCGGGGCGS